MVIEPTGVPDVAASSDARSLTATSGPVRIRFRLFEATRTGVYRAELYATYPMGIWLDDITATSFQLNATTAAGALDNHLALRLRTKLGNRRPPRRPGRLRSILALPGGGVQSTMGGLGGGRSVRKFDFDQAFAYPRRLVKTRPSTPPPETFPPPPAAVAPAGLDDLPVADCLRLVDEGKQLSKAAAAELELRLRREPRDLPARLRLLGRPHGETLSDAAFELLEGLIEHHPASLIAGQISTMLPAFDARNARVIEHWRRQIAAQPENVRVLGNAAIWLQHCACLQPDYLAPCKALFTRIRELEPRNPVWADHLGLVCFFEAGGGYGTHPELAPKQRQRLRATAAKDADDYLAMAKRLREELGLAGNGALTEYRYLQIAELACWRAMRRREVR